MMMMIGYSAMKARGTMRTVISFRKDGVLRYYGTYHIDLTGSDAMSSEVRCPGCGCGISEDDIQAGWKQYSLNLMDMSDQITLLVICPECKKHFAYVADVRASE